MLETNHEIRKNKINLSDYDFQSDIRNRILLRRCSQEEISVLEEILYSPLRIETHKLANDLDLSLKELFPILERLLPTELFTIENEALNVDKEKRKYFETLILKFEEDFRPGYDYLQNILKNVPIQFLPLWYQIPRSSNNIFESIVEKYLLTPQIFQRYLLEFMTGDDLIADLVREIYNSPELSLSSVYITKKFALSEEEYGEIALYLEYSLICTTSYKLEEGYYEEVLSVYPEWREYTDFTKKGKPKTIKPENQIEMYRSSEFAFIEDMTSILELSTETDLSISFNSSKDLWIPTSETLSVLTQVIEPPTNKEEYCIRLINKILILGLGVIEETALKPTAIAEEWIQMPIQKRAHVIFKHPHNFLAIERTSPLSTQRSVLEIEKGISNAAHLGWVYFDDFLNGSTIILSEDDKITLKRSGRQWRYSTPDYTAEQKAFIQYTVLEWLFESGIVQVGSHNSIPCFRLTTLGNSLFQ